MDNDHSVIEKYSLWLLAFYAFVLFLFMNNWGTVESSEARYAEIAREMLVSGDWIHPQLLNIHHYHKPPFTYWITGFGYLLFGVNPFGVRFFLAISGLVQMVLIFRIAQYFFQDKTKALAAALIYATLPLVIISIRGLTTDSYLQTFILLAIYGFIRWRTTQHMVWLYLIAIACGAGFLTKGPLILILPFFFVIGFYKTLPQVSFSYHHLFSFLLFIATGFSWFIYLAVENQEFIRYFLFRHTYERMANAGVFSRSEPFWYYLLYAPLTALPWTILLINGFVRARWRNVHPTIQKMVVFLVLLPITFFSLSSSKLILYVMPAFAGIAIISAYFLFHLEKPSRIENYVLGYFTLICLSFFGISQVDKSIALPPVLLIPPVVTIIILVGIRIFKSLSSVDRILLSAFVFTVFLLTYGAWFMKFNELKINSTRPLAAWIKEHQLQDRNILVYNRLLPSLAFHLNDDIISLHDGNRYLKREVNFEKDEAWKRGLFDLTNPKEADRLLSLLQKNPVMIVKGKVNPSSQWLLPYFSHQHKEGDWMIYY